MIWKNNIDVYETTNGCIRKNYLDKYFCKFCR